MESLASLFLILVGIVFTVIWMVFPILVLSKLNALLKEINVIGHNLTKVAGSTSQKRDSVE